MMIFELFWMLTFHEIFYQLVQQFHLQEFNVYLYCMRKSKKELTILFSTQKFI
jgi:hypothetical protein